MTYKIEACGDTVYVKADSEDKAIERLTTVMGEIPRSLLKVSKWSVALPEGEEFL